MNKTCLILTNELKGTLKRKGYIITTLAIPVLALLAMLAMGFLTWILLHGNQLARQLFAFTSRFRKNVPFIYYRLLDGLQLWARLDRLKTSLLLRMPS